MSASYVADGSTARRTSRSTTSESRARRSRSAIRRSDEPTATSTPDGTSADDPIYVPRDARDPSEIVFAGDSAAIQGAMFERFIDATPCLRRQRSRIVARNSCRGSWVNTSNLSVRQSLPAIWRHAATIQLDVFNVLNLLSKSWGLVEVPNPWILQYVGRTKDAVSQPTFKFDPTNTRTPPNAESAYQFAAVAAIQHFRLRCLTAQYEPLGFANRVVRSGH
jgi:hypothetical protein